MSGTLRRSPHEPQTPDGRAAASKAAGSGFDSRLGHQPTVLSLLLVAPVSILVFNRWVRGGMLGRTWGRAAVGIRLVDEFTGEPIGVGRTFVRDVAHLLDTLVLYLGWVRPLWNGKRQTFADTATRSVVIRG